MTDTGASTFAPSESTFSASLTALNASLTATPSTSPQESMTFSTVQSPRRNARHYWDSVVLLVGGELFKVPRYHLEKGSSFFRHLLAPRIELAGSDGRDDEQPIRLDEIVTVTEFETFLDMLYPPLVPSKSMRSQEEWAAILKLSTLWRFLEIRQLAIQTLTLMNLTAFTRIKLARDHFVAQWLRTGYADLVKQVNTMTVDEVESVGYLTAIRIFRVREEMIKKHWSASSRDPSFSTSQWDNEEVRKAVEGEFVGEMVDADKRTATYKIDQIKPNRPKNAGKRGPKPGFISRPE